MYCDRWFTTFECPLISKPMQKQTKKSFQMAYLCSTYLDLRNGQVPLTTTWKFYSILGSFMLRSLALKYLGTFTILQETALTINRYLGVVKQ